MFNFLKRYYAYMDGEGDDGGASDSGTGDEDNGSQLELEIGHSDGIDISTDTDAPTFNIPDKYKEKSYSKGIDSADKLWEQFDNAQSLIGKKSVPKDDADDKSWEEFYAQLRPKDATEYEFKDIEWSDEDKPIADLITKSKSEEFEKEVKSILHKNGLTKRQAENVHKEYTEALVKANKDKLSELAVSNAALDADFDELATKTFGTKKDKVLENSRALIEKYAPKDFRQHLGDMNNETLIVLAGVLNGIQKDYIKEDGPISATSDTKTSESEIRKQGIEMMRQRSKLDAMSPEFEALTEKINNHYKANFNKKVAR